MVGSYAEKSIPACGKKEREKREEREKKEKRKERREKHNQLERHNAEVKGRGIDGGGEHTNLALKGVTVQAKEEVSISKYAQLLAERIPVEKRRELAESYVRPKIR